MKFSIPKYQSVIYVLLFVFQIAFFHSATVQNFSIHCIHGFSHDSNHSNPSSDHDDLIDYYLGNIDGKSGKNLFRVINSLFLN
mgnify:CR=1 FL=1